MLVTGTVVYGKGDEQEVAEEIEHGMYDEDVEQEQQAPLLPPVGAHFAWHSTGSQLWCCII